ncbi:MAG TPA: universal stress protein [Candidatus Methylomirabilis sp.]|nr:universal stress protein [Candidatus Methylomirabilis sp.]
MRVLLATDGSTDALTATRWLRHFPVAGDSPVLVLTVAVVVEPPVRAETLKHLRDAILADARRIGDEAGRLLGPRGPGAELRVSEGEPRAEIVRAAEEWGAELVVVGARGLGGVRGLLVGSVSLDVARHAPCPVLVVKGQPQGFRRVVVAVDGSPDSLEALRFFTLLPLPGKLRVRLVGVVNRLRIPPLAPRAARAHLRAVVDQLARERRAEVETALQKAAAGLRDRVGAVELAIPVGRPGEQIVREATEFGADLVVVGARGLGGVKRFLLGSVSEEVLRAARCPVLIGKGPSSGAGGR